MLEAIFITTLGLIMGMVTSISGGSGVFAVPTMLAFGIPPINTLALNRLSDVGVIFGALKNYYNTKSIDWKLALKLAILLLLGSIVGTSIIILIPESSLKFIILGGIFIGIFFLLKPAKTQEPSPKSKLSLLGLFFMFLVGIWDGALAMAGATFAVLVLVHFFRKNFLEARATEIFATIPGTLITAIILTTNSTVKIELAILMPLSSLVGAYIGSHLAIKHGSVFIRKAMIIIALLMVVKIIFDLL